jgi:TPR repeat protein
VRDEVLRLLGKVGGGLRISEDELLVGQEEHLGELKRLLGLPQEGVIGTSGAQAAGEVGIVGVKGMGGVGKTTVAKKLYDEPDVREWFTGGVCWLEVGPKPSKNEIRDLQKQIFKQLGGVDEDPGNPTRGRELIRQRLNRRRVLICLDDVWEAVSTETAVVNVGDLAPGSRILKTSRKKESIGGHIHDLDALKPGPAWELFCWHAFGGEKPPEDLAELAKNAAAKCGGLPLALKVLGRQLAEANDKEGCITEFLKLPRHDDAMKACHSVVRTSYDNLPTDFPGLGDVFILVAGVWPRTPHFMQHQRAVENLGAAVYGGELRNARFKLASQALEKLHSLSLIGLKEDGNAWELWVTVHDLIVAETLADGRGPGCEKFYRQPVDADRLELAQDRSKLEHLSIHSGSLSMEKVPAACSLILRPGAKLVGSLPTDDEPSPCRLLDLEVLRYVRLHELGNLRCLRLGRGSFDLFPVGIEKLRYLCILEVTQCGVRTLPETVGRLTGLTSLDLSGCRVLRKLPESVGALTGLTRLDLGECGALHSLPESICQLTGLTRADLRGCRALQSLPKSFERLTTLTRVDLRGCVELQSLPESLGRLTGLTRLDVRGCVALESMPESVGSLTRLTSLALSWCVALRSLPKSIGGLTGLTRLDLSGCAALEGASHWWWAATKGDADAQYNLGKCYKYGRGVEKDVIKAADLFAKAADQGHVAAQLNLGYRCYRSGRGVEKDEARAVELFAKAAEQGDARGLCNLGLCYDNGTGVEKDEARAVELYAKAAEQGEATAQRNLGVCYANGRGVAKDEARAAELYAKAAEQGDATGQSNLGVCYENGRGVEKDERRAAELYARAAEQGDARGQCNLGVCYEHGRGLEKDVAKAVELYAKAADQGHAVGLYNLGVSYFNGRGLERDERRAAELYAKAADQGVASAQNNLGWCYRHGKGVELQKARAAELFEKAADQGVAWAQTNLGWCYEQGTVVKKDEVKAVELYKQAVEQGNAAAHGYLGRCYKLGRGVGKSEAKAVELWKKAVELLRKDADTGDAWAHGYLGELYAEGLGVEQNLAEAFRLF